MYLSIYLIYLIYIYIELIFTTWLKFAASVQDFCLLSTLPFLTPPASSSSLFLLSPLGHFHQLYFEAILTVLNREESAATLAAGGVHGPLAEASSPTRTHMPMSSMQFNDSTKRRCCHALGRHRNRMNFKIHSISGVLCFSKDYCYQGWNH